MKKNIKKGIKYSCEDVVDAIKFVMKLHQAC